MFNPLECSGERRNSFPLPLGEGQGEGRSSFPLPLGEG
jgi:hypothetical protein